MNLEQAIAVMRAGKVVRQKARMDGPYPYDQHHYRAQADLVERKPPDADYWMPGAPVRINAEFELVEEKVPIPQPLLDEGATRRLPRPEVLALRRLVLASKEIYWIIKRQDHDYTSRMEKAVIEFRAATDAFEDPEPQP